MTKTTAIAFALCAVTLAGCDYWPNHSKSEGPPVGKTQTESPSGGKDQVGSNAPTSGNARTGAPTESAGGTPEKIPSSGPSAGAGSDSGTATNTGQAAVSDGQSSSEGAGSGSGAPAGAPTPPTVQANKEQPNSVAPQQQNTAAPQQQPAGSAPLRLARSQVRQLQRALRSKGFDAGPADGVLGARTRQALRDFQSKREMQVTGEPDSNTLAALGLRIAGDNRAGTGFASTHPAKSEP